MRDIRVWPGRVGSTISIAAFLFVAGCGDDSVGPPEASGPDTQNSTLVTLLSDPWMTDVAAGVDDRSLRSALHPTGDIGAVRSLLARVDQASLSVDDSLAVSVLKLTIQAAEVDR